MTNSTAEARQRLLDEIAAAIDELGNALGALGTAYELLDEQMADRLEAELFRPVQVAYGRARRTHTGFAERHGLPTRTFTPGEPEAASYGVKGLLERAIEAVEECDALLSDLQDSMMPVEYGDPELRAGLAEVRELVGNVQSRAHDLIRHFGR